MMAGAVLLLLLVRRFSPASHDRIHA